MSSLPQKSLIHSSPGGFQALGFVLNREEFGFPVVRSSASIAGDVGSIPGWATKIPHAMCCSQQTNKEISLSLSLSLSVCVCVCVSIYLVPLLRKRKREVLPQPSWCGSVQSSHSVVYNSLLPHGLQHARLPCISPTSRACSNSCPSSRWCHPIISSSILPLSSCLQSFPASGSFPMNQFFTSGGQSIRIWASASVLPMNTQDWSPLGLTGLLSLLSKGLSRVFSNPQFKTINYLMLSFLYSPTLTSYMTTGKIIALTRRAFVGKIMSLLFNMLSSFSSKEQASFNFIAAVTICSDFGAPQNKVCHCFHYSPIYLPWSDGTGCHDLSFLNVEF